MQDLIRPNLRPVSPILATLSPDYHTTEKESISNTGTSNNCAKRSKCTSKKALSKYSSNTEVTVIECQLSSQLMIKKALM